MCQLSGPVGIACHSVRSGGDVRLVHDTPYSFVPSVPQVNVAGSPFSSRNGSTASEPPGSVVRSHSWMRLVPSAGRSTMIAISANPSPSTSGVANGSHPPGRRADRRWRPPSRRRSGRRRGPVVEVPGAGHASTSLIFVATEATSDVPFPSRSADMLLRSHTGNPSPMSTGPEGVVTGALGLAVIELPTVVPPMWNASER